MVNNLETLELFRDAREKRIDWVKLVRTLAELESPGPNDQQGFPWVKRAAGLSGYTVNQIRQMRRTLSALETLHARDKQINLPSMLNSVPYSHLEILARMAKIDPDAALRHLRSELTANQTLRYRKLRDEYYALRKKVPEQTSPIAASLQASRQFEKSCLALLEKDNAEQLYGRLNDFEHKRVVKRWSVSFEYANPHFVIETPQNTGPPQIDAADCLAFYAGTGTAKETTLRQLQRVAFEASFFSVFWVLLRDSSTVDRFESERKELALNNVRAVEVNLEMRSMTIRTAPAGAPMPDRRPLVHKAILKERERRLRSAKR